MRTKVRVKPSSSLDEELELDSADDLIQSSENQLDLFNSYKGIYYLQYIHGSIDLDNFDDGTTRSVAQKLLLIKCSKTITDFLRTSPLNDLFQDVLKRFKTYQRYTTVQVAQKSDGALSVSQKKETPRGKQLLEFKIHTSIHRGIEPRLTVGENLLLKYDVVREQPLLVYEFQF